MQRSEIVAIGEQLTSMDPATLRLSALQIAMAKSALSVLENRMLSQEVNDGGEELLRLSLQLQGVTEPPSTPARSNALATYFAEMEAFRTESGWELAPLAHYLSDQLRNMLNGDWES